MLDGADSGGGPNPLKVIAIWFEALPTELQTDLASLISTTLPELILDEAEAMDLDETACLFRQALRANANPAVMAIRAAAFSAAIDLILVRHSTHESWLLYEDFLKQSRDEALAKGKKSAASLVQSMIDVLPRRRALWIEHARGWRLLRSQMDAELPPHNYPAVMAMN